MTQSKRIVVLGAGTFSRAGETNDDQRTSLSLHRDHLRHTYPEVSGKAAVVTGGSRGIGAAALFLASSASSWIAGVTLDIADGKVML